MTSWMKFLTLDKIAGYRSIIGAWCQIISGVLLAVLAAVTVVQQCVEGTLDLQDCMQKLPVAVLGIGVAAQGVSNLGIRFQE
jgi:uncharacterized integral membrane protein